MIFPLLLCVLLLSPGILSTNNTNTNKNNNKNNNNSSSIINSNNNRTGEIFEKIRSISSKTLKMRVAAIDIFGVNKSMILNALLNNLSDVQSSLYKVQTLIESELGLPPREDGNSRLDNKTACSHMLYGTSGNLTSPNYPLKYTGNLTCLWLIEVPRNKVIELKINDLKIEGSGISTCPFDKLEIRDGVACSSLAIATLCGNGNHNGKEFISTGNKILLRFTTDSNIHLTGFNISYRAINKGSKPSTTGCGGKFILSSGTIHSPRYPLSYPKNASCTWSIETPNNTRIYLQITNFLLESSPDCDSDKVEIFDFTGFKEILIEKLCGRNQSLLAKKIISTKNKLKIVFTSDGTIEHPGFSIKYSTRPFQSRNISSNESTTTPNPRGLLTTKYFKNQSSPKCEQILTALQGNITSPNYPNTYPSKSSCLTMVRAPVGYVIEATIVDMNIETGSRCKNDQLTLIDGFTAFSLVLAKVCGLNHNLNKSQFLTKTNQLIVWFTSDSTIQKTGFLIQYVMHNKKDSKKTKGITTPKSNTLVTLSPKRFSPSTTTESIEDVRVTCGGRINVTQVGNITSPNYPDNYPSESMCIWLLEAPIGKQIKLQFLDFDVEFSDNCKNDRVNIYDGSLVNPPPLASLCDNSLSEKIYSSSTNFLTIEFSSDLSLEKSGFVVQYSIKEGCGGMLTSSEGTIKSPDYPSSYPERLRCKWTIEAPNNDTVIKLQIMDFQLEGGSECQFDAVIIGDIDQGNKTSYLPSLCGDNSTIIGTKILSKFNRLEITFISDDLMVYRGFLFNYVFEKRQKVY